MITIKGRGIIIPAEWDEKGNVVAVAIATHGEDEYLIESGEKGEKLKTLIRQEVQVSGKVTSRGGRKIIKIKEYKLIQQREHGGSM